jgi:hypothetical protein
MSTESGHEYETTEVREDGTSEAVAAAGAAETGLIHLPLQHGEGDPEPAEEDEGLTAPPEPAPMMPEAVSTYGSPGGAAGVPDAAPVATPASAPTPAPTVTPSVTDYAERVRAIQLGFIDDPRQAALAADDLLAEVVQTFADDMARRRRELESATGDGATPDTERLRLAVRRSRELVELLSGAN